MRNRILTALLAVLVTAPAYAGFWVNKDTEIVKRDLSLFKLYVQHEVERASIPPGATIPKNKQLAVVYPKERVFDLAKASKSNAINAAVIAAVAAAGWSIDELTKQVTQPNWINPPTYTENTFWHFSIGAYHADDYTAESLADTVCREYHGSANGCSPGGYYQSATMYRYYVPGNTGIVSRVGCPNTGHEVICGGSPEQIEGEPTLVPDPTVVDQVMPYLFDLPDYQLDDIFDDDRGVPLMTPELQTAVNDYNQDLADADPNLSYDPNTGNFTYTDPVTQDVTIFNGDVTITEGTDTTAGDTTPNGWEWPDFCDWTSMAGFCDSTEQEQPTYQDVIDGYGDIETDVGIVETPLPSLWSFPVAFGGAASCQGINFDYDRNSPFGQISIHFTMDKHCEIAATIINPVLAWFFGLLTVWFCMETYREETMRGF